MAISGSSLIQFGIADGQTVGVASLTLDPKLRHQVNWSDGEGASAVEDIATKVVDLTTASPTSLDLTSGFTDLNGAAIPFKGLKVFMAYAPSDNAADVTISLDDANAWDSICDGNIVLKPGSSVMFQTQNATAYTVTNSTKDIVTLSGTTGDEVQIAVAGTV